MVKTSCVSPSTPSPSDEQRVMLIAALMALGVVAVVMSIKLASCVLAPSPAICESEVLPARDVPLLTPEQREEARRSGVAAYELNGIGTWITGRQLNIGRNDNGWKLI